MMKKNIILLLLAAPLSLHASPLTEAVENNDITMVKNIITKNNIGSDDKDNALLIACQQGNSQIVDFLLTKGAHVNTEREDDGLTPLILAITNENPDPKLVRLLLRHKANVNEPDNSGTTPLGYVRQQNEFGAQNTLKQIEQILIDAGGN